MLERVIRICGLKPENIVSVFQYGSRVYGNITHDSDYDFIVINNVGVNDKEIRNGDYNIHLYDIQHFQDLIDQHKINALECFFLSQDKILLNGHKFNFKLDLKLLRAEFSAKASNSYVKCAKKLDVEKETYIGLKSLFHSLRILDFGTQIAVHKKIIDYSSTNHYYYDIMKSGHNDWEYFKEHYQPIYNALATEFRKVAPK